MPFPGVVMSLSVPQTPPPENTIFGPLPEPETGLLRGAGGGFSPSREAVWYPRTRAESRKGRDLVAETSPLEGDRTPGAEVAVAAARGMNFMAAKGGANPARCQNPSPGCRRSRACAGMDFRPAKGGTLRSPEPETRSTREILGRVRTRVRGVNFMAARRGT